MNKKNIVELVGIYIILIGLSYAFYVVLVAVKANDSVASSLLSWSATMFATIALLYTFNSWRNQKGSEMLSTISKDCHNKLTNLKDLVKETVGATSYQFKCWIISDTPHKHYNNKYQYLFDDLNNKVKEINNLFEIIKTYNKDRDFNQLVNDFDSHYRSIKKQLESMDYVIGTINMANEYKSKNIDEITKSIDDLVVEFNKFIDEKLNDKLVKYIFFKE